MDQDTDWITYESRGFDALTNQQFVLLSVLSAIRNTPDGQNVTKIKDVEKIIIDDTKVSRFKYQRKQTEQSLMSVFKTGQQYSLEDKIKLIEQLANGVFTYYKYQLFHGKLHPDNIFIDTSTQDLTLGLSLDSLISTVDAYNQDFDIALPIKESNLYDAPEIIVEKKKSAKSDAYSFGVIVMQILTDFEINDLETLKATVQANKNLDTYLNIKDVISLVNASPLQRILIKSIKSILQQQKNQPQGQEIQQKQQSIQQESFIRYPAETPTPEGLNPSEQQQAQPLQEQNLLQNESDGDIDIHQQSQRDIYYSRISTKTIQVSEQQQIYLSKAKEVNIIDYSLEKPFQQLEKDKLILMESSSQIHEQNKLRIHNILLILIEYAQIEMILHEEIQHVPSLPMIQAQISGLKSRLFNPSNITLSLYMKTIVLKQSLEEDTSFANLNKWYSYFKSLY